MPEGVRIGEWRFSPSEGSLSRNGERRRLEPRAGRVLALLCERPGEAVSSAELVEKVWNGRSLSRNSVTVVIAALRRALDDESRNPRYIETISKHGYRLVAAVQAEARAMPETAEAPRRPRRRPVVLALAAAALALAALVFSPALRSPAPPPPYTIAVTGILNRTGNVANDPLAPAIGELVVAHLGEVDGLRIVDGPARAQWRFYGSVILWNGHVMLMLHAADARTGTILWSVMAAGPPREFPRQVSSAFDHFQRFVRKRRATGER
jgi:DNA-binding winged helix-turn-helix (wHTH) protein